MGITDYFRILKVDGKIEVHHAMCVDYEYGKFFVSENVEADEYNMFGPSRIAKYEVYKVRFSDLKELFDHMKRILSKKDYALFFSKVDEWYYKEFINNYKKWLASNYNDDDDDSN